MDGSLTLIVLVVLTFATALNLFLTLRLAAKVRTAAELSAPPSSLPIGRTVPAFEGTRRADGARIASQDLAGQAAVLVFLSAGCPKCREKAAELLEILPAVRRAGVALWIMGADAAHDVSQVLGTSPLLDHVLVLDAAARQRLNPRGAAPFYIFIDDRSVVQASSFVGDEDWLSFVGQMREIADQAPE
ncbi:redoxin domain-containing protein [Phenylobacterium sp.]|uniref:redoxin domain-containing protein n=1 Tax=Phenylobacterium sp. TaxID=1871053 RepID=UPI002FCAD550